MTTIIEILEQLLPECNFIGFGGGIFVICYKSRRNAVGLLHTQRYSEYYDTIYDIADPEFSIEELASDVINCCLMYKSLNGIFDEFEYKDISCLLVE